MNDSEALAFTGLVELAAASLGGRAIYASDDFFAGVENLLQPGRAVFRPGEYTDRGKWMDGWESRRRRGPGHDFCVIELGARGRVLGFDIDTLYFDGNHPPFASIDGLDAPRGTSWQELAARSWTELLPQSPLRPTSQNLFVAQPAPVVSHVRLNIFPDGGVARLRVFGQVEPAWDERELDALAREHVAPDCVDLVALKNGGRALACSDARFGAMNQLLLPGRARDMSSGWETRRNRFGSRDWLLLALGARGTVDVVEVDTGQFKGNFPERCSLEGIDAPGERITTLLASDRWTPLLPEVRLAADTRHFFVREVVPHAPVSHVRFNIFPDGGVSRLRLWGRRDG